jgi:hypothetical protein
MSSMPEGFRIDAPDVLAELARHLARMTSFCDYSADRLAALDGEDWAVRSERTEAEVRQFQVQSALVSRLLTDPARLGLTVAYLGCR